MCPAWKAKNKLSGIYDHAVYIIIDAMYVCSLCGIIIIMCHCSNMRTHKEKWVGSVLDLVCPQSLDSFLIMVVIVSDQQYSTGEMLDVVFSETEACL